MKFFKNVFVTYSGFCLNSRGLVKECHHDFPNQYSDYLKEAAKYYYSVQNNPDDLIILDSDNNYLVIHHPWFNYYHWICESIFRLWIVRRRLQELILLLPVSYKYADFIMGSLEPFKIKSIHYIPHEKSLMVKNICLPQIKPICDSYNRAHVRQIRDFYQRYVLRERKIPVVRIEKLYVTRQLAGRRKVINEEEIIAILNKYGFTVFYPEHFSFLDQVAIFCNVRYLVAQHGSALTNLLFMSENTSVLELHKNKTHELNHPSPLFWYMAETLGINYYHQSCEILEEQETYFEGDYIVDVNLFESNLTKMLSNI